MTVEAFDLSEKLKVPVLMRIVTRLAHSRANVHATREAEAARHEEALPLPDPNDWTLVPSNARRRFRHLLELQSDMQDYSQHCAHNVLSLAGRRGIIASGIAYNYVREALGDTPEDSLLKISVYPLPLGLVRDLVAHCDEILVVEDGYPFIEQRLNGLLGLPGKKISGKAVGPLPPAGELTPELVANAIGLPDRQAIQPASNLVNRPPQLCRGCPHADTFKALIDATAGHPNTSLFSDIGCYTLGALAPYNAVHSCVDMGASISMAHGASRAGAFPVLCTIGDSTFTHSGMTPLIGAVRNDADMTVIILDNATVAMTGAQETMASGEQLIDLLRGLGVKELRVFEPLPRNHKENTELLAKAVNHRGLSVLVARRPCIQIKPAKKVAVADAGTKCAECGDHRGRR